MAIYKAHRSHYTLYNGGAVGVVNQPTAPGKPKSLSVPVSAPLSDTAGVLVVPTILNALLGAQQAIEVWTAADAAGVSVLRSSALLRVHGTLPAAVSGYRAVAQFDFSANELSLLVQRMTAGVPVTLLTVAAQGGAADAIGLRFEIDDDDGGTLLRLSKNSGVGWIHVADIVDFAFVGIVGSAALSVTAPAASAGNKVRFGGLSVNRAQIYSVYPATDGFESLTWIGTLPAVDSFESALWPDTTVTLPATDGFESLTWIGTLPAVDNFESAAWL